MPSVLIIDDADFCDLLERALRPCTPRLGIFPISRALDVLTQAHDEAWQPQDICRGWRASQAKATVPTQQPIDQLTDEEKVGGEWKRENGNNHLGDCLKMGVVLESLWLLRVMEMAQEEAAAKKAAEAAARQVEGEILRLACAGARMYENCEKIQRNSSNSWINSYSRRHCDCRMENQCDYGAVKD